MVNHLINKNTPEKTGVFLRALSLDLSGLFCFFLRGALFGLDLFARCGGTGLFGFLFGVFFNTARCVEQFLLTRVKWVAFVAQFDVNLFFGGTDAEYMAAGTSDLGRWIIRRMSGGFHRPDEDSRNGPGWQGLWQYSPHDRPIGPHKRISNLFE